MRLWDGDALFVVEDFVVLASLNRIANEIDIGNALFKPSIDCIVWVNRRRKIDFRIEDSKASACIGFV